ncbi:divergent polysaccharide deacetylase family protein [Halopseudomonas xinjiangensis]|uniref:divergent polysaccharide deacetylase family protein n=1 Tax=Halopseudomonas xinjiangensis TaxID=487184 RepID=UPI0012FDCCDF|nr:divergent polysaccharide deacetylase family protein [Halopseudomonas xinjiangensis]
MLLASLLAGCDTPEPSLQRDEAGAGNAPAPRLAATPERDRQRVEWIRLEHAGWRQVEAPAPVISDTPAIADISATPSEPIPAAPALAIIIDDVGHGYAAGRHLIDLPFPVALAILPYTPAGPRLAAEAASAGKTVMLHLPMENLAGSSPGPGGLYAHMDEQEFMRTLEETLDSLPSVQGVNNHMGSRLTALRPQMDWVMAELAERGLFFIDSRTQAATQAAFAAQAQGVPSLSRDVFLDNTRNAQAMEAALQVALGRARRQGFAVLIGHPYPETLAFLASRVAQVPERDGVQLVSLESLFTRQSPLVQPVLPQAGLQR